MSRFFNWLVVLMLVPLSSANADDRLFRSLDKNADSKISPHEIDPSRKAFFDRAVRVADTNHDGELSASEFQTALTPRIPINPASTAAAASRPGTAGKRTNFRLLDRNQDGMISLQEVPPMFKTRLQQFLERTGQESIAIETLEQMTANTSAIAPNSQTPGGRTSAPLPDPTDRQPRNSRTVKPQGPGQPVNGQPAPPAPKARMQAETVPSNRLSLDIPARLIRNFDRIDANKDGGLDRAEILKAFSRAENPPADRQ